MRSGKTWMALALMGALSSGAAQAALHDRGGGLVYDDVLDVTWLADANYAKTSGYDADGLMTWQQAMDWAANLSYYDSVRGVTYDDWRLPFTRGEWLSDGVVDTGRDQGYSVRTVGEDGTVYSELAHMYHNNLGFNSLYGLGSHEYIFGCDEGGCYGESVLYVQSDYGIFEDGAGHWGEERDGVGPNGAIVNLQSGAYWSGSTVGYPKYPWYFNTMIGIQEYSCNCEFSAWALRPGDVAAVPEPMPAALFGVGLAGLMLARRRSGAARV